jgi:hypothetical protein
VRVPRALPALAVGRVVCEGCRQRYDCEGVDDVEVDVDVDVKASGPQSRLWKYLSIPVAAAAVILILVLVQGSGGEPEEQPSSAQAPAGVEAGGGGGAATVGGDAAEASESSQGAELVKGASYTLALPQGWARIEVENGATFAASARDGGAEATLWVQRDPSLDFPQFEAQSLAQLRQVAGSAEVTERTTAPTADGTIVTLAADSPAGAPTYDVTLRLAGPYRYYLATTVEPNASRDAADGAELIHSSFVPVATEESG